MPDELGEEVVKQDTTKDPNEGKTMLDFVKSTVDLGTEVKPESDAQTLGKTEDTAKDEEDPNKKKGDVQEDLKEGEDEETDEQKKAKEGEKEQEGDKEEDDETTAKEEEKGPVPYERFEEVNNKYKVTAEEYEKIKPLAETHVAIQDYCNQWGITQDQFRNLLDIQRLLNTEPDKALAKIMPIVEQIQGFTGDKLPSDLQKEVDNATLPLERAREIAKLRAQTQFGGARFQQYQQIQQERQQQQFQQQQVKAINAWVQGKAASDPDFRPRKDASAPRGRYEFVYDAMQGMLAERDNKGDLVNMIRSPEDVPKLLEKAYQEVIRGLAPMTKKPATKGRLTQNGSTSRNTEVKIEQAKSMGEAIRIAAAAHGL